MKRVLGLNAPRQPIENIIAYRRSGGSLDGTTIFITYFDGESQDIHDSLGGFDELVADSQNKIKTYAM